MHLNVGTNILKSILYLTGSQCRLTKCGEMCSHFCALVIILAALFWRVYSNELLQTNLDEMNAFVTVIRES